MAIIEYTYIHTYVGVAGAGRAIALHGRSTCNNLTKYLMISSLTRVTPPYLRYQYLFYLLLLVIALKTSLPHHAPKCIYCAHSRSNAMANN
jgi:hypothetical protein